MIKLEILEFCFHYFVPNEGTLSLVGWINLIINKRHDKLGSNCLLKIQSASTVPKLFIMRIIDVTRARVSNMLGAAPQSWQLKLCQDGKWKCDILYVIELSIWNWSSVD